MLKIVIVGYGEMFANLIAGTLDANCEIVGVLRHDMIKYNPIVRRIKDTINPSVDYNYIKSYNLPEIEVSSVNSERFKNILLKLNPDIVLVGSWSEKFKKEIFNIPKIATINAHPSLLPKYRGPNPYFWTIKNRELVSGITFHLMDNGLDTGAILAQEEVKIYPSDTGKSLKERIVLTARGVICELLKALREDIIIPLKQQEDKATYYSVPDNLELDFLKSADENYALLRAIYPWGMAHFYHKDTCLVASHFGAEILANDTNHKTAGTITNIEGSNLSVLCGDNKILKFKAMHLKKIDRLFTKNYIKRDVKIGDNISI